MKTIDKIITKLSCKYGSPMGRASVGVPALNAVIYDCLVPMSSDGAYDRGGAYWGLGAPLRVRYTKDLSYIEFYRSEIDNWIVIRRNRKLGAKNWKTDKFVIPVFNTVEHLVASFPNHK